ncbi:hypothetical protein PIB30_043407 [Stylosanthes scabra]|uniref:Uncharacterized protein n=1 Tax=Stylosanthes scabra TaxID=79078 RepID=A0ABU6SG89_9FABA|nr:hypothetical protein [Stylosanthes scabra]
MADGLIADHNGWLPSVHLLIRRPASVLNSKSCNHGFLSLSLEEAFQSSFQLLEGLIRRNHPFFRGIQRHADFFAVLVVVLNVHHLWLGGLVFVSFHYLRVRIPTDSTNVKYGST